ncbi:ferrochelatase [Vibrio kyushuensis]|uniref:ferrochelatase n=1 Tax=Vibrio kyushuensis TaxID=2910249 RepID=UPI003D09EEFE
MTQRHQQGALLVNLGTPTEATTVEVKRFLSQFLLDSRVVDMSRLIWYPLLKGVIIPFRAPKVAKLYQAVWQEGGSPLMVYSQRQAVKLEKALDMPVELGMTYGSPSIQSGIEALQARGVDSITVLPLYPQYSGTTTAAVSDAFGAALSKLTVVPSYQFISSYQQHPLYIEALAQSVRRSWEEKGRSDYLLCSYHGIPKRFADNGDVYPLHCEQTTQLLAKALDLPEDKIGMTYQSRFGREEWLKPYVKDTLEELPKRGYASLDIISPAFSVDCLETLEEIAQECQEIYKESGGELFNYIPCLNDDDEHIEMMKELVKGTA